MRLEKLRVSLGPLDELRNRQSCVVGCTVPAWAFAMLDGITFISSARPPGLTVYTASYPNADKATSSRMLRFF